MPQFGGPANQVTRPTYTEIETIGAFLHFFYEIFVAASTVCASSTATVEPQQQEIVLLHPQNSDVDSGVDAACE